MMIIVLAVGYTITKVGFFSKKTRADLTDIVIYAVLP